MSYIKIKSFQVKELCNNALKQIEIAKEQQFNAIIKLFLDKEEKSWWRKLWRQPVSTHEEMRERLLSEYRHANFRNVNWNVEYVQRYFGETAKEVIARLLVASQLSDEIIVSTEDLSCIMSWNK